MNCLFRLIHRFRQMHMHEGAAPNERRWDIVHHGRKDVPRFWKTAPRCRAVAYQLPQKKKKDSRLNWQTEEREWATYLLSPS